MRILIIMACLCQGILSLDELKTSQSLNTKHTVDPECFLNISGIINFHNYPSEEYHVETKDGYILTIYRIPHGRYDDANKVARPVVLLQHGALGDGSHWISNLPNNSLGFILADNGYDVWLGNSRGNTWSSNHKTLKPWQQEFWRFSFHEMGYYDIPAVLYFILNKTKQQQLYYVAHSQGTSIVGCSTPSFNMSRMDVYAAHSPAGTTVKNLVHWSQVYHKNRFQAYDYGTKEKNMEKYNQVTPPIYKIEDIKIPIALWTGGEDLFVNSRDFKALKLQISNLIYHQHIPEWQHLDYIWGLDATERMYMDIIKIMKRYQ